VALKNSVYVLPNRDACREDLSWLRREVVDGGGEAAIFEANTVEGFTREDLQRMFRQARAPDYEAVADKVALLESSARSKSLPARQAASADIARLEEQLGDIERVDFFSQHEARTLRARLGQLRSMLRQRAPAPSTDREALSPSEYRARTWVTRTGVKVDRIACAWLIKHHIDPRARFRFVEVGDYSPKPRELRFDMPEGEFTHEGDLCSFEVLCSRFALVAPGLRRIAEVVHDLDVKDARYGRPETEGVRVLIQGLVAKHASDVARIEAASPLFDALMASEQPMATSRRKR
jgi:hypothetical protein